MQHSPDEINSLTKKQPKSTVEVSDVAWKKLSGDVFRKPDLPMLFCVMIGTGVQCAFMIYIVLISIVIGLINPYLRYFDFIVAYILLTIGGLFNGYVTTSMMRFFGSNDWKLAAGWTAFFLPLCFVIVFTLVDVIEYFEKAEQIFPFTSVVFFSLLWAAITVPLTFFGAYRGFMRPRKQRQVS